MSKCKIVIGILAHVDAGKTTLSESMLYETGRIRKLGRVDHGDTYLDNNELERSRGITIFSKQAEFQIGEKQFTLLDTPGHVDFSTEMERTLQVLDYAVLVINGADGVQGHTKTVWKLLENYQIPTFLFVNKMDQMTADKEKLDRDLKEQLSENCVTFFDENGVAQGEEFFENIAVNDEKALEEFLENGNVALDSTIRLIRERSVFPVFYGAALKQQGVREFLQGIHDYMEAPNYPSDFGARVYKITRDSSGARLTHMKITGGSLKVKEVIEEEKVNQIRVYSGEKYELLQEADAGTICAVTGLIQTEPGQGLGVETEPVVPVLESVLGYKMILPEDVDPHTMLLQLRQLEEEDPMLRILWNEELRQISIQLMGEIQIEILKSLIEERFGVKVAFDAGDVVYKETIRTRVEGVGHYEPLRHYAEVHLILEPGEPGSGMVFATSCSEDDLDKNWQRLILTHLQEKEHRGVLTGSVLTDMKITLAAGRAHLKHTEGGDFRQSTYRAVRQGLMQAESVLLEPYYRFHLELPTENLGRAMNDVQTMHGEFDSPESNGEMSILTGAAPVSKMRSYQLEVLAYTKGRGRLSCVLEGYRPCEEAEDIIREIGYDPESDVDNPTGSVFCSHGAGYYVPWDEVFDKMHIESCLAKEKEKKEPVSRVGRSSVFGKGGYSKYPDRWTDEQEKELEDIFVRTYGKVERKLPAQETKVVAAAEKRKTKKEVDEFLLVDGYNVIHAWDELKDLAKDDIDAARNKLMDILCNYQGFKKCNVILVFDAYQVDGKEMDVFSYHNIHVVYTKESETADMYIEKVVHHIGRKYHITVATSDAVEQVITAGQGAAIISARELYEEITIVNQQIWNEWDRHKESGKRYLFDSLDQELAKHMEEVRLGKRPE